jgi:hypothetical protein
VERDLVKRESELSNNRIVWSGLEELKAALRTLPAELAEEAGGIVLGAAEGAKAAIIAAYPARTGDLRKHVTLGKGTKVGRFGASTILKNNAKHAWIFENGSQARSYVTVRGKKHLTGRMPPGHVFVPIVIQHRRAMYERLKELLVRHGLVVSGEAAA